MSFIEASGCVAACVLHGAPSGVGAQCSCAAGDVVATAVGAAVLGSGWLLTAVAGVGLGVWLLCLVVGMILPFFDV